MAIKFAMTEILPVVLASASPARKNLLMQAGINPIVISSNIDEERLFETLKSQPPQVIVENLARAKAEAVLRQPQLPKTGVLIAADSMWEFENELVGKPKDLSEAKIRISAMSGKSGILHTGHCVMNLATLSVATKVISTEVLMDKISEQELASYLATGEPLAVAGSFTLNGFGAAFVKSVIGDSNNVIGLSINTVKMLTNSVGLDWTKAWANITYA